MYKFYGTGTKYFNIDRTKTYKVQGVDSCGNTDTFNILPSKELRVSFHSSCGSNKVKLFPFINLRHIQNDSCMIYGIQEISKSIILWQSSDELDFKPNVTYNFYAKDTCCNISYSKTAIYKKTTPKATLYKGIYTSYDSTSGIRIITSNFSGKISVLLIKAPYTSKDKFTPTRFHKKLKPRNYTWNVGDTMEGYVNIYFSDLPKGKYEFVVFDTCGNKDTVRTEILTSDLWRPKYTFKSIQKCPSNHLLLFSKNSNIHNYGSGTIKKILPTNVTLASSINFYKGDKRDTFLNNGAGTYVFEYLPIFYNSIIDSGKIYFRDTIIIKDPGYPIIDRAQTYGCSNKTSSIIVTPSDGVEPYRFRIRKNGSSTWSKHKTSNEFHGIAPDLYQIEISDACGNATTALSSSGVFTAPKVKIGYICFDDSLLLFSNKINGVNYRWTKNDIAFSTTIENSFKPFTKSDYGNYKLQVYLNTPQGVCVDTTLSIVIGDVIEVEDKPIQDCDSTLLFGNWIKNSGIYRDTAISIGGCDSVSKVEVYIGKKVHYNGDTTFCDSLFLFDNWYSTSQKLVDTIKGAGFVIDTLEGTDFEQTPKGWVLNNTSTTSGNSKSPSNKIIINRTNDWIEIPPVDNPEKLSYYYKLSANNGNYNKVLIQYFSDSNWISIEEHFHNSSTYENLQTDLKFLKDSTNVLLRIKASFIKNTSVNSFIDDIYVTKRKMACDTFINLNLIGSKTTYNKDSITFCDSGTVQNKKYYFSQTAIDTLLSSSGCDSIITTKIKIHKTKRTNEKITYCDSGLVQGKLYYNTKIINDTLMSYKSCDSIITTDLTINSSKRSESNIHFCDSGILNNKKYYSSQTFYDTTSTITDCDSIIKVNVNVDYTKWTDIDYSFCDSGKIEGKTYYASQTLKDTFNLVSNCDSIITTKILINKSKVTNQNFIYCDSGLVHNKMYYSSQLRKDTFLSSSKCDSIVNTGLTINKTKNTFQDLAYCDSGLVHSNWYSQSQIIKDTFLSFNKCDSIVHTNLTITNSKRDYTTYNLCDSGFVKGKIYYTTQTVRDTFKAFNNCDSIILSQILVHETKRVNNSISTCDKISINGKEYKKSQIVIDTLSSFTNCDSIITTDLEIRNSTSFIMEDTFCKYYEYALKDGTILTTGGVYRFNYQNTVGCDSTFQVNLFEADCPSCTVFFPNAITLNFDSRNEIFKKYGTCDFKKYSLKIFNRWGELLFETSNPDEGWNGKFNGKDVQQGVYLFQVRYINIEQKVGIYSGDISVFR